ncbi:MAG: DegT/DnrJ/EryC1/StrS family aminotransferase [Actinomycetota bacterium]|nr:DegT/DnrJ/EryC1/StrS family aminotransferase [Actinomycetota bacterium]
MTVAIPSLNKSGLSLPVGQLYFPSKSEYDEILEGIFERRYFTNHGPSAYEFEYELADFLNVKHVILTTNATIALAMMLKSAGIEGEVIVPSFTFVATVFAIKWAGCTPIFADIDENSHHINASRIQEKISENTKAILVPNLWGDTADIRELEALSKSTGVSLFFDSAQAFGCEYRGKRLGSYGKAEVFSFHATKILSAGEGGCVATNDDLLASKLRNMRSSYGAGKFAEVPLTSNARFSELQAEIGRWSLRHFARIVDNNRYLSHLYVAELDGVPGFKIREIQNASFSNSTYLIAEVNREEFGVGRDNVLKHLFNHGVNARRYFAPGIHRMKVMTDNANEPVSLPATEALSDRVIQLPLGSSVHEEDISRIGNLVRQSRSAF